MSSAEIVALEYLRAYCEYWAAPHYIMRLAPVEYQGWHIVTSLDETITLTREAETHVFNLKKLIVRIDKELGRIPDCLVSTPRELAKLLIKTRVEGSHSSVEDIAHSGSGFGWYGYDISVGGLIAARMGPGGKFEQDKRISCWHILVAEFEGEDGPWIFDLREIYHEVEMEIKQGYAIVQPTLF